METIYEIHIKGWGEYEDAWYPHNRGSDIESLKKAVADEEKVLATKRAELDLAQAEGAGIAAAEAAKKKSS